MSPAGVPAPAVGGTTSPPVAYWSQGGGPASSPRGRPQGGPKKSIWPVIVAAVAGGFVVVTVAAGVGVSRFLAGRSSFRAPPDLVGVGSGPPQGLLVPPIPPAWTTQAVPTMPTARESISLEARCQAGQASACNDWGMALRDGMGPDGKGTVPDPPASAAFFKKACDAGDILGCHNLGAAYAAGTGVSRDGKRAVAAYTKACDGDFMGSCMSLGLLLQLGFPGVPADRVAAKRYMQKACKGGMDGACVQLSTM